MDDGCRRQLLLFCTSACCGLAARSSVVVSRKRLRGRLRTCGARGSGQATRIFITGARHASRARQYLSQPFARNAVRVLCCFVTSMRAFKGFRIRGVNLSSVVGVFGQRAGFCNNHPRSVVGEMRREGARVLPQWGPRTSVNTLSKRFLDSVIFLPANAGHGNR